VSRTIITPIAKNQSPAVGAGERRPEALCVRPKFFHAADFPFGALPREEDLGNGVTRELATALPRGALRSRSTGAVERVSALVEYMCPPTGTEEAPKMGVSVRVQVPSGPF
jgi:hypothetical protein